jgi:hypothetical protein
MIKETLERRLDWASNPAEDARWCEEWGYRAFALQPTPGATPCLLLAEGTRIVGVAAVGDTLVFEGARIVIRTGAE